MDQSKLQQVAKAVKESRIGKKYTQKELADLSGISLRSIQRLENAEVAPRFYTLNVLAQHLGISLEEAQSSPGAAKRKINFRQKVILSIAAAFLITLLASAFVFQSLKFPETAFEASLYLAGCVALYAVVLLVVWS